jgi:hypothetical protein
MSMDEHVMVVSNGSTHRDGDGGSSDGDGRDVVMELASNHENYAKKNGLGCGADVHGDGDNESNRGM